MDIILLCIAVVICVYFYNQKNIKGISPSIQKDKEPFDGTSDKFTAQSHFDKKATATTPSFKHTNSYKSDKTIEEQYGHLPCDGKQCGSPRACLDSERLFCRDIISKVKNKKNFKGQFEIKLPTKTRYVDFVITTDDDRKIAIEMDGYWPHAKNISSKDFDEEKLRQNEILSYTAWNLLRFSYNTFTTEPGKCIRQIERCIANKPDFDDVMVNELIYAELTISKGEDEHIVEDLGALWSKKKGKWCILSSCMNDIEKFKKWNPAIMARCLTDNCSGEIIRRERNDKTAFFWACPECKKTFIDYNERPVKNRPNCLEEKCDGKLIKLTNFKTGQPFWKCTNCQKSFDYQAIAV